MYEAIFTRVGLSIDETRVYEALLENGPLGAGDLLTHTKNIKRGLLYKVLERLTERGLVIQEKKSGKALFVPQPPESLLHIAESQEEAARKSKESLQSLLPALKAKYNLSTERPVIRYFEGVEGLREMYEDKLASGAKDSHFIRTARAEEYRETFGKWFTHFLKRQTELGISAHALTVDDEYTNHDPEIDAIRRITRLWIRPEDYTAPVQIDTYGDKVSIFAFGKEIFGILIESKPIATSLRELFVLAERGAKTLVIKHDHPTPKKQEKARRLRELNEDYSSKK